MNSVHLCVIESIVLDFPWILVHNSPGHRVISVLVVATSLLVDTRGYSELEDELSGFSWTFQ